MTCIVAIEDQGKVHIGADTVGASGWNKTARRDGKLFRLGEAVIGFTSSYRMGQILRYLARPPVLVDGMDLHEAMVIWSSGEVRDKLKDNGYTKTDNGVDSGGEFIVGIGGRIFIIEPDFQVAEPRDGFTSVGCGQQYALGALHGLESTLIHMEPIDRLQVALDAAARFSNGVGGPFEFMAT